MTNTSERHDIRLRIGRYAGISLLVLVVALCGLSLAACSDDSLDVPPVKLDRPAEPRKPANADLSTPENAVRSYLDFLSYAYRLGRSDVASHTMGPDELMRVDSYIELDRQRGRTIDQRLDEIAFGRAVAQGADRQLVPAREKWTYRYVDRVSGTYKGSAKRASFSATFTVERAPAGWIVTSVEATSAAPPQ